MVRIVWNRQTRLFFATDLGTAAAHDRAEKATGTGVFAPVTTQMHAGAEGHRRAEPGPRQIA